MTWTLFRPRPNPRPIFVVGNQKSGTTVIAALLGELAGLSVTLDLRGLYEPIQGQLHRGEISFASFLAKNRRDFSRDIIKEPALTLLVPALDAAFPDARYVFVVRDPRDNIRSILNRLGISGDVERIDEADAASRIRNWSGWRTVLHGEWLGIPYPDHIGALAGRWKLMTDILEANRARFLLVRYEDFARDKQAAIRTLAAALQLREKRGIADKVDHQYQPAGDRTADVRSFFGARNLERIEQICAANMQRLGYRSSFDVTAGAVPTPHEPSR